jgi:LuxR family transcriptional regulator, maltose regulon positive regulatory protein
VAPVRTRSPSEALSDRELAVLRFLPTRLTNEEIGRECFMSVNTVKTHLKSVYSKFGTTSRAATVDHARAIGLL